MASAIKDKFHIKDVHVIPGDSDSNRTVKREMGQQAGQLLEGILYEDAIVSVTGGSTMACVSESIHLLPFNVFFVPARGGLGEKCCLSSEYNRFEYGPTSWWLLYNTLCSRQRE